MKKPITRLKNNKGFTLIELGLIIAIVGILALMHLPKVFNVQKTAFDAQRNNIASSIRDGIYLQFAEELTEYGNGAFPSELDSASNGACSTFNPCFENVLSRVPLEN